ncbi:uncharacterized protein LOC129130045 [Agelaius phoeniceus]|uniref:uncharacterized protein LOC129130045 n=1 Tax=Agelaius phoeniceus TaxID=39638 RepID=UPI004054CA2E
MQGSPSPCTSSRASHSHRSSSLSSARGCLGRGFLSPRSARGIAARAGVRAAPSSCTCWLRGSRHHRSRHPTPPPRLPAPPAPVPSSEQRAVQAQRWRLCPGSGSRRVTGDTGTPEARAAAGHGARRGAFRRCRVYAPAGAGSSRWDGGEQPRAPAGGHSVPSRAKTRGSSERTLPAGHGPAPRPPPATAPQPRGSAGSRSWHGRGSRAPAPARRRGGDSPRSRLQAPRAACPARAGRAAIRGWMAPRWGAPPPSAHGGRERSRCFPPPAAGRGRAGIPAAPR